MSSRNLLNLTLLLLILGLGALVWFGGESEEVAPPAPISLFSDLPAAQVNQITLQSGDRVVKLAKRDGDWWLEEPLAVMAQSFRVESLLNLLTDKPLNRFKSSAEARAQYGLTQPTVTARFNGSHTLEFGQQTPLDQHRYLGVGEEVLIINEPDAALMTLNASDFINPRLIPKVGSGIRAIRLPKITVSHNDSGWQVEPPQPALSADQLAEWVESWRYAMALKVTVKTAQEKITGESVQVELADGEVLEWLVDRVEGDPRLFQPKTGLLYQMTDSGNALLTLPKPEPTAAEPSPATPPPPAKK